MFNPARLGLARTRRGLTKRRLAKLVGVTEASIRRYEDADDALNPSPQALSALAKALDFPTEFFSADDLDELPEESVSFRALSKMTAAQKNSALAAGRLALALHDWIAERFHLPAPDIPKLGPGIDPETASEVVRTEWDLGEQPISNLVHLLEAHGVRVFSLAEECREVDAFSCWRSETPFVFLNTQKTAEHSRMDAAHELGHLVLHWHHDVPRGRPAEEEARRFASAFLMPRSAVLATAPPFPTIENLIAPKCRWRVSLAAYIYRLHKLGALSDWGYRSLNIEISKRGRAEEPHGLQRRETSQVLNKVFNALRKSGTTKANVARALHIKPSDLDDVVFGLAMLPVDRAGPARTHAAPKPPKLRLAGED